MRILLHCHNADENYSYGCKFALVDLDRDLARSYLDIIATCRRFADTMAKAQVDKVSFYVGDAQFFSVDDDAQDREDPPTQEQEDELAERIEALTWLPDADTSWGYCILSDDVVIDKKFFSRTECDRLVCSLDGISYSCYPENVDEIVDTATIPLEVIRQAAELDKAVAV